MERVSRECIGSRDNCDARVMNCLEQAQHSRESVVISCLFIRRNFERATPHRAPHLRRKARHDFFQAGRNRARVSAKKRFKDAYRRVEDSVMLAKKIDEITDLGFVRSKFAGALGDFDKPIAITRFLYFRKQKIEHDKIEMLNFISAAFDELAC